jgi:hypothetical protein
MLFLISCQPIMMTIPLAHNVTKADGVMFKCVHDAPARPVQFASPLDIKLRQFSLPTKPIICNTRLYHHLLARANKEYSCEDCRFLVSAICFPAVKQAG